MKRIKSRAPLVDALEEILEASIVITGADYGNVQMVNREGTGLEIVAQRGFNPSFLDHFALVPLSHGSSACGRAAQSGRRVMISDIKTDPTYKEHLEVALGVPYRAVQSTPLFDSDGELLGMLSTHFKKPKLPNEKYLHMFDLYALQAAHVIEVMRDSAATSLPIMQEKKASAELGATTKTSLKAIETLPFFADLSEEEKLELLQAASFKHLQRGEPLFMAGDPMTYLYWVCAGAVQEFRETPDGHELTSAFRIAGDVLYNPDAQGQKHNHVMNAKALQLTTLLCVPMSWIDSHMKTWDHLAGKFMQMLSEREQESRIETEHQATMNASQIVACFLQHLCVSHHFDPRGFTLPYTKSIIASRLGMELESFSRVLPKLRDLGITVKGKQVAFSNLSRAQDYACGSCSVTEECSTHRAMQKLIETAPTKKATGAAG